MVASKGAVGGAKGRSKWAPRGARGKQKGALREHQRSTEAQLQGIVYLREPASAASYPAIAAHVIRYNIPEYCCLGSAPCCLPTLESAPP